MAKNKLKVIHKPGGYEAYKDVTPIRKPQWRVIGIMAGSVFACGVISAFLLLAVPNLLPSKTIPTETGIEAILQAETTVDPAFSAIVSQPLPTNTSMPTATQIIEPTQDFQATLDFIANELSIIQTQTAVPMPKNTPMPTNTPLPEATPEVENYSQYAIITYNNVIIRRGNGQNYGAVDMLYNGARYPVIQILNGWVQIAHPEHNPAWIASHLLRIEDQ